MIVRPRSQWEQGCSILDGNEDIVLKQECRDLPRVPVRYFLRGIFFWSVEYKLNKFRQVSSKDVPGNNFSKPNQRRSRHPIFLTVPEVMFWIEDVKTWYTPRIEEGAPVGDTVREGSCYPPRSVFHTFTLLTVMLCIEICLMDAWAVLRSPRY